MSKRQTGTTTHPIVFDMIDSTDHISNKSGLTVTALISKDGGVFASAAGTVSEIGTSGVYALSGHINDRNTLGTCKLNCSAAGADPTTPSIDIVGYDPYAAKRPSTIAAGDIATGAVDANSIKADAVTKIQADTARTYLQPKIVFSGQGVLDAGSGSFAWATGDKFPVFPYNGKINFNNTEHYVAERVSAELLTVDPAGATSGLYAFTVYILGVSDSNVISIKGTEQTAGDAVDLLDHITTVVEGSGTTLSELVGMGGGVIISEDQPLLTSPLPANLMEVNGESVAGLGEIILGTDKKVLVSGNEQNLVSTFHCDGGGGSSPVQYISSLPIASIAAGTLYEAATPGNLNSVITESGGANVSATNCSFNGMTITGAMTGEYYFSLVDSIFKKGFINSYVKIMGGTLVENTEINSDLEVGATNPATKYRNVFRNCHWNTMNANDIPSVVNLSTTGAAGVIEIVDCSGQIKFDVLGGYSNPYIIYVRNFKGKITFSSSMSISQTFHFNGLHGVVDGTIGYAQIIIDGQNRSHILYVAPASNYDVNAHTDYAVSPLAIEANVEGHVSNKLIAYDSNGGVAKQSSVSAVMADTTSLLARIGAFTGTGINTVLGFFKALLKKDASTPSDIGGTFTPTTDSVEAVREKLDSLPTTSISQQEVRDSLKLASTAGAPAVGSVDQHLDDIISGNSTITSNIANAQQALDFVRGWVSGGQIKGIAYCVDPSIGVDDVNHGGSWQAPFATISYAFSRLTTQGLLGIVFAKPAHYFEEVSVPPSCILYGISDPIEGMVVVEIRGNAVVPYTNNPTLILNENSRAVNIRVGRYRQGDSLLAGIVMKSLSKMENCSSGGFLSTVPTILLIDGSWTVIKDCWYDGSGMTKQLLNILGDNNLIEGSTFSSTDGYVTNRSDLCSVTGHCNIIRENSFLGAWTGKYVFNGSFDNITLKDNTWAGEEGSIFHNPAAELGECDISNNGLIRDMVWDDLELGTRVEGSAGDLLYRTALALSHPFKTWVPGVSDPIAPHPTGEVWLQIYNKEKTSVILETRLFAKDGVSNPILNNTDVSIRGHLTRI